MIIWTAFRGIDRSDLVRMVRDLEARANGYTAASYRDILENQIPTLYEPGHLFIQDNARIYTARIIKAWFAEHSIDILEWPFYSPDLNPIEHLWRHLKEKCYQICPDISTYDRNDEERLEKLNETLEIAWHLIGDNILDSLVESIQRRVEAVILVKG